jgi:hypothetical protein
MWRNFKNSDKLHLTFFASQAASSCGDGEKFSGKGFMFKKLIFTAQTTKIVQFHPPETLSYSLEAAGVDFISIVHELWLKIIENDAFIRSGNSIEQQLVSVVCNLSYR